MLQGKKILLGISGSIAAYKAILLVRLLVKSGAEVKVVMTNASKDFVSPLVLSTLSKNSVLIDLETENAWANHVELGRWADVMIIAPASCNTLAKMANGICDNLLLAVYLSATCNVAIAPAMDEDMWQHPSTKRNLDLVKSYNTKIIPVEKGELASGLFGEGRMAEPEFIVNFLIENYFRKSTLANKKVIVTAGPTYEAIDPVRFIGNYSSGKMGYAIAEAFFLQGADVTLVSGTTNQRVNYSGIEVVNVTNSDEMFDAVTTRMNYTDVAVMCAAVADYKPVVIAENKIKKKDANWQIELEKTKDILHFIGNNKKQNQFVAGFALETENEKVNAISKLKNKNADCIILNSFSAVNRVFGANENKITIIDANETEYNFDVKPKNEVANDIVSFIISKIKNEK
ncbi:MAG: bifunctional phosphopantothenoylcysteine decarboxylase/phosphopantothenate--cysteine ligase CoaBC [Chitinophagaceae bacterium]